MKKSKDELERKKKEQDEIAKNMNPLARLMASGTKNEEPEEEEKFADGFVRSKRNTELRVKQDLM